MTTGSRLFGRRLFWGAAGVAAGLSYAHIVDWPTPVHAGRDIPPFLTNPKARFNAYATLHNKHGAFVDRENFLKALMGITGIPSQDHKEPALNHAVTQTMFDRLDGDKDGWISVHDWMILQALLVAPVGKCKKMFFYFDQSGNGKVDKYGMQAIMRVIIKNNKDVKLDWTKGLLKEMWAACKGDYVKWRKWLDDLQDAVDRIEFQQYDVNDDGFVDSEALSDMIGHSVAGSGLPRDVTEHFSEFTYQGKKYVPYEYWSAAARSMAKAQEVREVLQLFDEADVAITTHDFGRLFFMHTGRQLSNVEIKMATTIFGGPGGGITLESFIRNMEYRHQRISTGTGSGPPTVIDKGNLMELLGHKHKPHRPNAPARTST